MMVLLNAMSSYTSIVFLIVCSEREMDSVDCLNLIVRSFCRSFLINLLEPILFGIYYSWYFSTAIHFSPSSSCLIFELEYLVLILYFFIVILVLSNSSPTLFVPGVNEVMSCHNLVKLL